MRNYKLDTSLLPKVWVHWEVADGTKYYLNCQTGKKKTTPESWMIAGKYRWSSTPSDSVYMGLGWFTRNAENVWVKSGSNVKFAYAKYHADTDTLEVAAVGIETTRKEEKKEWKFLGDRFFIKRDKTIVGLQGNQYRYYDLYKYHTACDPKELIRMLLRLNTNNLFVDEFKKFIGANHFTIGNGNTIQINYPYHLQRWYETVQKTRGKGKEQQLTDQLTSIELSDTSGFAEKYPVIERDGGWNSIRNITYFERVNDDWSVLRLFARNGKNILTENYRVYIGDNGRIRIVSQSENGWIPSKKPSYYNYRSTRLVNGAEAIEKCNRIKYILKSITSDKINEDSIVNFLMGALRFSEVEQLIKFGYASQAIQIAKSSTPKADLKNMFGGYYNEKEKNLLKKVGMTKNQLEIHLAERQRNYYYRNPLTLMREIFGNTLNHIDDKSFKKYYTACQEIQNTFWSSISSYAARFNFEYVRFFKNLVRLAEKHNNTYTIAKDTLEAYSSLNLNTQPEIDWYWDDFSDLIRSHDAITELRRIQDEERRAMWNMEAAERRKKEEEKRIKIDEERKCYEYEDDEYIIRLPKDLNEIVREGSMQSICIGGYTSCHALGNTNLFFLRKKNEPEVPFYAIEMNNAKNIVQIHGKCNQWLGCNPEAIPTVVRWLRKNGIQCDEKILTCKARGYGRTDDYVPMPVVD